MTRKPLICAFFDEPTYTVSHLVADPEMKHVGCDILKIPVKLVASADAATNSKGHLRLGDGLLPR